MNRAIPHSAEIRKEASSYIDDVVSRTTKCARQARKSGAFRGVYKTALASDAVLGAISSRQAPTVSAARSSVRRVPILVSLGQLTGAALELRRLIELTFWAIYFSDHPVEWAAFSRHPGRAVARGLDEPIRFCARREVAFYSNYAKELFAEEPSGLAKAAAGELQVAYGSLSSTIHAGVAATRTGIAPVFDSLDETALGAFSREHKRVSSTACILLSARFVGRLGQFPPAHRAWFDWLIGPTKAKTLRAGPFGLSGTV